MGHFDIKLEQSNRYTMFRTVANALLCLGEEQGGEDRRDLSEIGGGKRDGDKERCREDFS